MSTVIAVVAWTIICVAGVLCVGAVVAAIRVSVDRARFVLAAILAVVAIIIGVVLLSTT